MVLKAMNREIRLIDANALEDDCNIFNAWDAQIVKEWLKDQPTIEAQPIRHGQWEQVDDTKCRCSSCSAIAFIALYPNGADKNYCPNCGAKMVEGINENSNEKLIAQIDAVKEMINNIYFGRCNSLYHTEHRDIVDRLDEIKNELAGKE